MPAVFFIVISPCRLRAMVKEPLEVVAVPSNPMKSPACSITESERQKILRRNPTPKTSFKIASPLFGRLPRGLPLKSCAPAPIIV